MSADLAVMTGNVAEVFVADDDLATHGFNVVAVRDAPDRPGKELVFVAQHSGGVGAVSRTSK